MEGIIVIDKPKGITSFDVIRVLRKTLKEKRIGHTGTLDPLATGVLIICIGRATKLAQDIEGFKKRYVADFELGYKTDTYDIEGKIIAEKKVENITKELLEEVLEKYRGEIEQIPPMYSAIKINGEKLYDLARKGIEIERKARKIEIFELKIIEFDGKKCKIECEVSKGTYIRSLIYDIGEDLGVYATMTGLRRVSVGDENVERAYSLNEIEMMKEKESLNFITPIEKYFRYPKIYIDGEKDIKLFLNGQRVKIKKESGKYRVYENERFLGLGEVQKGLLKGYKYY